MLESECIIVFAKPAMPGLVKTRLVPPLSPQQAARFHLAATQDTVSAASRACERVKLHVAGGESDLEPFRSLCPERAVRAQEGEGLGARLAAAFGDAFARGFGRVLIVGSDHPSLPAEYLAEGLRHLRSSDIVFGPSRDGGYYAVGVRGDSWPKAIALFDEIPWSTPGVLETSLKCARAAGLRVTLTPEWYDVGRPQDLVFLERDAGARSEAVRLLWSIRGRVT
jgi:rSAM/selenodomain-associated transferase 1